MSIYFEFILLASNYSDHQINYGSFCRVGLQFLTGCTQLNTCGQFIRNRWKSETGLMPTKNHDCFGDINLVSG